MLGDGDQVCVSNRKNIVWQKFDTLFGFLMIKIRSNPEIHIIVHSDSFVQYESVVSSVVE